MAKPKRLKLRPEDRVTGVQPRQKRDLFAGCNEPGKAWFHPDPHVFMKAYCRICKNADCVRAKGAVSPWHTRMAEQVDYLLNDPQFSDMKTPEHLKIADQAFDDIGRKMMRLEIARQNQDWEIPEDDYDGSTDGVDKVASPETTDQFDEAVRKLAKARGKEEPKLSRPEQETAPAHFQAADTDSAPETAVETAAEQVSDSDSEYEYDTQYPSTDGTKTYLVALDKQGKWSCECDGFRYRRKCHHLDEVRAWYNEQLLKAEAAEKEAEAEAERQQAQRNPPPPPRETRVPPEVRYNTPMPQEGLMIGGGNAPDQKTTSLPAKDPWAIPDEKVVDVGAKVTLKSTKKNE